MSHSHVLISPQLNQEEREELTQIEQEIEDMKRPRTRRDCADIPRPCPFVSCKYNLYLDIDPRSGSIKLNFPDQDIDQLQYSCALDLAEKDSTLEEIGNALGVVRERIRQIEAKALERLRRKIELSPIKPELLQYLSDASRHEDKTKDLSIYDPNPKRITWDEWRLRFVAQEPKETINADRQMLRGRLLGADQKRPGDVPKPLAPSESKDTGRGSFNLSGPNEGRHKGSERILCGSEQESASRGSRKRGAVLLDERRDRAGNLGQLSLLPNDALQPPALSPVPQTQPKPEQSNPSTEERVLVTDLPSVGMEGIPARGVLRKERMPAVLNSNLGRLSYALRNYEEEQLFRIAADLRSSPHQEELLDRLRRYIADSCAKGKHKDLLRAQQCFAILLGREPRRKDNSMKSELALALLELLSARPDKADLIEALAIEAGLFAARSVPATSAAFDSDLKPETTTKKKAPAGKKERPNERKGARFLTEEDKSHIRNLLKNGWSNNAIGTAVGCPASSFSEALKGKMRMKKTFIAKIIKLQPREQVQAAE